MGHRGLLALTCPNRKMPPPAESENSKSCEAPAGAWLCSRPPGRQPKPQAGEYCDAADESCSSATTMTGTKHQAKKAAACQAKKPNEKGSHHQNGIRKHRWTKGQLFRRCFIWRTQAQRIGQADLRGLSRISGSGFGFGLGVRPRLDHPIVSHKQL
jgi:hypothetical protein